MRINRRETQAGLTRNQAYLVSCWHNLVHSQSLDSYRVRVMNPELGIEEVLKMQEFKGASADERKQVREEVAAILKADPLLNGGGRYDLPTKRLIKAMLDPAIDKEAAGGPVGSLLKYFAAELSIPMKRDYIGDALTYLANAVVHGTLDDQLEPARFAHIKVVVSHMLSILISRGTSLESLFALYSALINPERSFERRWDFVSQIMAGGQAREFHIVIALDNVTSPEDFPPSIGGIQFSRTPQLEAPQSTTYRAKLAQTYLRTGGSRLFASTRVNSHDARVAGDQALDRLNRVVNLIRFEYEAARVTIPEAFAYQPSADPVRTLQFPSRVPNPSASVDSAGVQAFVEAVDELVLHAHFQREGLDRVHSAFRLYRTGLDTTVLENKLVNWWTALEYLVRGAASDSAIGQSVERLVTPVLAVFLFLAASP